MNKILEDWIEKHDESFPDYLDVRGIRELVRDIIKDDRKTMLEKLRPVIRQRRGLKLVKPITTHYTMSVDDYEKLNDKTCKCKTCGSKTLDDNLNIIHVYWCKEVDASLETLNGNKVLFHRADWKIESIGDMFIVLVKKKVKKK